MINKTQTHENLTPKPVEARGLVAHLTELRRRLIYSVITFFVVMAGLLPFSGQLYTQWAWPLLQRLPDASTMIATKVISPVLTPLAFTFFLAFMLSVPVLLYHLWAFIAPGLYQREKRVIWPLLVSSVALFYVGGAFVYWVVLPVVIGFFVHATPDHILLMPDIHAYLSFSMSLFIAFGVVFEVPILIVLLVKTGIVRRQSLARKRPFVLVGAFILGMLLTPPDVISQLMLAMPCYALFELGLLLARLVCVSGRPSLC